MNILAIISILIAIILAFIACMNTGPGTDNESPQQIAQEKLEDATEAEKNFFTYNYMTAGKIIASPQYKKELEQKAKKLKVIRGTIAKVYFPVYGINGGISKGRAVDIKAGTDTYQSLEVTSSKDTPPGEMSELHLGTAMLIFCIQDDEGGYRMITSAREADVTASKGEEI